MLSFKSCSILWWCCVLLLLVAHPSPVFGITINEVYLFPSTGLFPWVELYNDDYVKYDVSGHKIGLKVKRASSQFFEITQLGGYPDNSNTTVPAYGYLRTTLSLTTVALSNNVTMFVSLYNSSYQELDTVQITSLTGAVGKYKGSSIPLQYPTPSAPNASPVLSPIAFMEIFNKPVFSGSQQTPYLKFKVSLQGSGLNLSEWKVKFDRFYSTTSDSIKILGCFDMTAVYSNRAVYLKRDILLNTTVASCALACPNTPYFAMTDTNKCLCLAALFPTEVNFTNCLPICPPPYGYLTCGGPNSAALFTTTTYQNFYSFPNIVVPPGTTIILTPGGDLTAKSFTGFAPNNLFIFVVSGLNVMGLSWIEIVRNTNNYDRVYEHIDFASVPNGQAWRRITEELTHLEPTNWATSQPYLWYEGSSFTRSNTTATGVICPSLDSCLTATITPYLQQVFCTYRRTRDTTCGSLWPGYCSGVTTVTNIPSYLSMGYDYNPLGPPSVNCLFIITSSRVSSITMKMLEYIPTASLSINGALQSQFDSLTFNVSTVNVSISATFSSSSYFMSAYFFGNTLTNQLNCSNLGCEQSCTTTKCLCYSGYTLKNNTCTEVGTDSTLIPLVYLKHMCSPIRPVDVYATASLSSKSLSTVGCYKSLSSYVVMDNNMDMVTCTYECFSLSLYPAMGRRGLKCMCLSKGWSGTRLSDSECMVPCNSTDTDLNDYCPTTTGAWMIYTLPDFFDVSNRACVLTTQTNPTAIWYQTPVADDKDFVSTFFFKMSSSVTDAGIAFAIQNVGPSMALSRFPYDLGIYDVARNNWPGSKVVAVELDCFTSFPSYDTGKSPHIALVLDDATSYDTGTGTSPSPITTTTTSSLTVTPPSIELWNPAAVKKKRQLTSTSQLQTTEVIDYYDSAEFRDNSLHFVQIEYQSGNWSIYYDNLDSPVISTYLSLSDVFQGSPIWVGLSSSTTVIYTSWIYETSCPPGYMAASAKTCADEDECIMKTHHCDISVTECVNTKGSYNCSCLPGLNGTSNCTDIDECITNTHECQQKCLNGTYPFRNYTCGCDPGYQLDDNGRNCSDFDECAAKIHDCPQMCSNTVPFFNCSCFAGYIPSNLERNSACLDIDECALRMDNCQQICTNLNGSFSCSCHSGYITSGNNCTDIDECVTLNQTKCDASTLSSCVNTKGSYTCSCPIGYTRVVTNESISCEPLPCAYEWNSWTSICTNCSGQVRRRTRNKDPMKNNGSPLCFGIAFEEVNECVFPCSRSVATSTGAAATLYQEWWTRGATVQSTPWLKNQDYFPNVTVRNVQYDSLTNELTVTVDHSSSSLSCAEDPTITNLSSTLYNNAASNLPNFDVKNKVTQKISAADTDCTLAYSFAPDPIPNNNSPNLLWVIGPIIAAIIIIFVVCMIYMYYQNKRKHISVLPSQLRKSFFHALQGRSSNGFYCNGLRQSSDEYSFLIDLLQNHLRLGDLVVQKAETVFNPLLLSSFTNTWLNMKKRLADDKKLWSKADWMKNDPIKLREWMKERYTLYAESFDWNKNEDAHILPMVHGTGYSIALKICASGFAALSSLDAGYYGKGIYFTESCLYAVPYFSPKRDPAIIVSYVLPGNVYPTTENKDDEDSLLGKALKNGYSSHFVVVNVKGNPLRKKTDKAEKYFFELVIAQEAQVVPAYLIQVDKGNLDSLLTKYNREIANFREAPPVSERKETTSYLLMETVTAT